VTVTEDVLFAIDELVLLGEIALALLVFCDVLFADGVPPVKDELLDVEPVGGGFDVALFVLPLPVPFELGDGRSTEKAYCGKIRIAKNEKNTRDLVFMQRYLRGILHKRLTYL